ncbi:hypothetical protein GTP91_25780 [Rugamonas sp. FT82W]|uniref:Uncharacterized protein n=1 Tax=Duganella vulcania TaxID=2692166 RepID=A0A845GAE7_9BURK|nr:hypothetical protein [Duganella vulcania]MYM90570.1 hypothetical protein [Duganella vulcania]
MTSSRLSSNKGRSTHVAGTLLGLALAFSLNEACAAPDIIVSYFPLATTTKLSPSMSNDGRYTVFASAAVGNLADIFVHDRSTGAVQQVNYTPAGNLPTGAYCGAPLINADGRYVLFTCRAAEMLGAGAKGTAYFYHDRATGKTETVFADGGSGQISLAISAGMSGDGRFVVYRLPSSSPTAGLHLRDMVAKTTQTLPAASSLLAITPSPIYLSTDGRFIAYQGKQTTDGYSDMSVFDRVTGVTELVSKTTTGKRDTAPNKSALSMSADGNVAVYASDYTANTGASPTGTHIYVWERRTGMTEIITAGNNSVYVQPHISANGRYVAYLGRAATDTMTNLYVYDRLTKTRRQIPNVFSAGHTVSNPSLSGDGRYLVFDTNTPGAATRSLGFADLGAAAGLNMSSGELSLIEGGAAGTYTLVLTRVPNANVTVTITPDKQISAARSQLVFTPENWNVPQVVSVQALQDGVAEGLHAGTITHTVTSSDIEYTVVASSTVKVAINDAVVPTVVLPGSTWMQSDLPVSGTAAPGSNVMLTATNRSTGWLTSVSVLADAQGNWSRTLSGLSDGVIEIDAQADGIHSVVQSITVALLPPAPISLPPAQQ